jgi:hypothetical protein
MRMEFSFMELLLYYVVAHFYFNNGYSTFLELLLFGF